MHSKHIFREKKYFKKKEKSYELAIRAEYGFELRFFLKQSIINVCDIFRVIFALVNVNFP